MAKKSTATKKEVETVINPYEFMLILSPDLQESEVKKKLKEIEGMIEKAGGKITHEDFWDKKNLAYKIKKHWEGIYMVYNIELPNTFIKELKEHLRIEKEVLRSMILTLPPDYTYTKYDIKVEEEPRKEVKKKKVSIKKVEPVVPVKPAPSPAPSEVEGEAEGKKEEKPAEEAPAEKKKPAEEAAKPEKEEEAEELKEIEAKPEAPPEEPEEAAPEPEEKEEEKKPKKEIKKEESLKEPEEKEEEAAPAVCPKCGGEMTKDHVCPVAEEEKEEEEKEEEEKKKKKYESELDRKLDALLGGEDLNL